MMLTILAVETGIRGSSSNSRMWDEFVTQDAVWSVRGKRRIQARSYG